MSTSSDRPDARGPSTPLPKPRKYYGDTWQIRITKAKQARKAGRASRARKEKGAETSPPLRYPRKLGLRPGSPRHYPR
jgi:hypothetical protein